MTDINKYLPLIGRVMSTSENFRGNGWENYNQIYSIMDQLAVKLQDCRFPDAPSSMEKMNTLLNAVEIVYACPEFANRAITLLSTYNTNKLFDLLKGQFCDKSIVQCGKNNTQIPFIIFHDEKESIEALNFADERIVLDRSEYKTLVKGSKEFNIALNRIVQAFIIKTPLKTKRVCFIFDNIHHNMEDLLGRTVDRRILWFQDDSFIEKTNKKNLKQYDYIICGKGGKAELAKKGPLKETTVISVNEIDEALNMDIKAGLLGFSDGFKLIETQIKSFFAKSEIYSRETIRAITADMVRTDGDKEYLLRSIKSQEESRLKQTQTDDDSISEMLQHLEGCYKKVEEELEDINDPLKRASRQLLDAVFETLFTGVQSGVDVKQYCLSRLFSLKYDDCDLVEAYLNLNPKIEFKEIDGSEWEKGKMYLELADLDSLPSELLKQYLSAIEKDHMNTGKEYYARSLVQQNRAKIKSLKESFDRGYEPAGKILLDLYKNDPESEVNLHTLANAVMPEACMLLAEEQEFARYPEGLPRCRGITDRNLTYYKIAATKEYLPAIGLIVDRIYEAWFTDGYQLSEDEKFDQRNLKKIKNSRAICGLCRFLLEKQYQITHYREILGVVLFSINENPGEAIELLGGIDTGIANYCKGVMYEYGNGTAVNLNAAISHYEKAVQEDFHKAYRRLQICQDKKIKRDMEREWDSYNYYNPDNDYSESYTYTYNEDNDDSFCFITTAACQALKADDDCPELKLLRQYRNQYIQSTVAGELLVQEYYRIGPQIVKQINQRDESKRIYNYLWRTYIEPSYETIKTGKLNDAEWIYIDMVEQLCKWFDIELRPAVIDSIKQIGYIYKGQ